MAIAFDNSVTKAASTAGSTLTETLTITAGTNMGLVVFAGYIDAASRNITSVTYNGTAMTATTERETAAGGGFMAVQAFYLEAPDTGSAYSVTVTWNGNAVARWFAAVSYSGVSQIDMFGAEAGTGNTDNTPSATLTATANDSIVVGGYTFYGGDGDPSTPDDTERWDFATGTSTVDDLSTAGGEDAAGGGGSQTVSMTASASDIWVMSIIEILSDATDPKGNAAPIFF